MKTNKLIKQHLTLTADVKVEFEHSFNLHDIIGVSNDRQTFLVLEKEGKVVTLYPIFKPGEFTYDKSDLFPGVEYRVISRCVGEYDIVDDIEEVVGTEDDILKEIDSSLVESVDEQRGAKKVTVIRIKK